jgi:hypothetical protein
LMTLVVRNQKVLSYSRVDVVRERPFNRNDERQKEHSFQRLF